MRKTVIGVAVLGVFAVSAQAQSSLALYGVLDTGLVVADIRGLRRL